MNIRTPNGTFSQETGSSNAIIELEIEMHETTEFEAFEAWIDSELIDLEDRFCKFMTRNSFVGAIGR